MNYAPELLGVGRYSGEIGAYLAAQGNKVEVVTTAPHYPGWKVQSGYRSFGYRREWLGDVAVTRCPLLLREKMRGIWRVLAPISFAVTSAPVALWRILRLRPGVILTVEPTLLVAPVALFGAWLTGARAVLHVQDLEVDAAFGVGHVKGRLMNRIALAYERAVMKRFDRVVTISNEMRLAILKKGVSEDRVSVVRNWVDIRKIVPLASSEAFRRELEIADDRFVALYAGNIGLKQALHIVLDAAERLAQDSRIVFVIAGDGPERVNLQSRYGRLPNVRFLPPQPESRLCELLNLANLHLLPQDRRAADLVLPSKLGGMLATGRDILVAADPGTELYNFLYGAAIIVPSGDSAAMSDAIRARAAMGMRPPKAPHPLAFALDAETSLAKFADVLEGAGPDQVSRQPARRG